MEAALQELSQRLASKRPSRPSIAGLQNIKNSLRRLASTQSRTLELLKLRIVRKKSKLRIEERFSSLAMKRHLIASMSTSNQHQYTLKQELAGS